MSILRGPNAYLMRAISATPLWIGLALLAAPVNTFAANNNCITAEAGDGFQHEAFAVQTSQFTAVFDATPSNSPTDEIVALSHGPQNNFGDFAALVRFNRDGNIDARNGGGYAAAAIIPFHAKVTYTFSLEVDVVAHTYTIYVKQGVGKTILVGKNFAFRTQQANVFSLDSLGAISVDDNDRLTVCKLVVTANAPQIANPDCTLLVPDNPLSATGLATPYQLVATDPNSGPCIETDPNQSAFVHGVVIDPATGKISVYNPLVITRGTKPAVVPTRPNLPDDAVVALWFGYNGNNLHLKASDQDELDNANCVNGFAGGDFGQFSYCNAVKFFKAAHAAIGAGQLVVPALAVSPKDGKPCPTPRSFGVIDQDPSDNVLTTYLMTPAKTLAQRTKANIAALAGATTFGNPSDERLVDVLLDPALGCTSWTVPDLADPGQVVNALPLNELQAGAFQQAPVALVGAKDPMVLVNGVESAGKLNAYRRGVDQPQVQTLAGADPVLYCTEFRSIHVAKLQLDQAILSLRPSPFPLVANSLFTFLAQRYVAAYALLDCPALLNKPVNVSLTLDGNGVVTAASFLP